MRLSWALLAVLAVSLGDHRGCHAAVTSSLEGRLAIPGFPEQPFTLQSAKVALTSDAGDTLTAHFRIDGSFRFPAIPPGAYLLDVHCLGYVFPQFRVVVSSKRRDQVTVTLLASGLQQMEQPLYLTPLGVARYYVERKPMDLKAWVMSPYGLMAIFAVVALFVLPMMKVDPEEMKRLQEEMKDSPLSGLLGGPSSGASATPAVSVSAAGPSKKKR